MNNPKKIAVRTKVRFLSPFVAAERGYIDEAILLHDDLDYVRRGPGLGRGVLLILADINVAYLCVPAGSAPSKRRAR